MDNKNQYYKKNYYSVLLRFNLMKDFEVIYELENQDNITDYIRKLIIEDLEKKEHDNQRKSN